MASSLAKIANGEPLTPEELKLLPKNRYFDDVSIKVNDDSILESKAWINSLTIYVESKKHININFKKLSEMAIAIIGKKQEISLTFEYLPEKLYLDNLILSIDVSRTRYKLADVVFQYCIVRKHNLKLIQELCWFSEINMPELYKLAQHVKIGFFLI